jgi:hypothetical protein
VKRERRLVREDARALRPEPHRGELFVLDVREVNEAVDTTALVHHAAGLEMLLEQLRRVARLGRLARREETRLGACHLEEGIPVRRRVHARTLTSSLFYRQLLDFSRENMNSGLRNSLVVLWAAHSADTVCAF